MIESSIAIHRHPSGRPDPRFQPYRTSFFVSENQSSCTRETSSGAVLMMIDLEKSTERNRING
jgi:hypothetical protein